MRFFIEAHVFFTYETLKPLAAFVSFLVYDAFDSFGPAAAKAVLSIVAQREKSKGIHSGVRGGSCQLRIFAARFAARPFDDW